MPKVLEPDILYVSKEFGTAAHLCPCGCGAKIRTPLGPTEWSLEETDEGPTLRPSVGNWQQECRSHYWVTRGQVVWAGQWTPEQVEAGRRSEEVRRREHYEKEGQKRGILSRLWAWIKSLLGL